METISNEVKLKNFLKNAKGCENSKGSFAALFIILQLIDVNKLRTKLITESSAKYLDVKYTN